MCGKPVVYLVLACQLFGFCAVLEGDDRWPNPDFTKGGGVPKQANNTAYWNLGATGARGWISSQRLSTEFARQIYIHEVKKGTPADGILKEGDVILGAYGRKFEADARMLFGRALTYAESEVGKGELELIRWRSGTTENVVIELEVLGSYSPTAPFNCPKSKKIFEAGCEILWQRMSSSDIRQGGRFGVNSITRSMNALALLASENPKYLPHLKKEARWAADMDHDSMQPWWNGYLIIFLSEYVLKTGDKSVMPGLKRMVMEAARGQSRVGSWGHGYADENGNLGAYGMMNAPGHSLNMGLILARKAGIDEPELDVAIEKNARLTRFFVNKGCVPYGDHMPIDDYHEGNGKSSMSALMFDLLDEPKASKYFACMAAAAHYPEREIGHTGNFWNMAWALPAVSRLGPHTTGGWMAEFGSWYFDMARQWDMGYVHQGPPQTKVDNTPGWDTTGVFLLGYSVPLRSLYITGKDLDESWFLPPPIAESVLDAGRGWSMNRRTGQFAEMSDDDLLGLMNTWSPPVRDRIGRAFAERDYPPMRALIEKLESGTHSEKLTACQAFIHMGAEAKPALNSLRKAIKNEEHYWVRTKAAEAISMMGKEAMPYADELLQLIADAKPSAADPRNMEQRLVLIHTVKNLFRHGKANLDDLDRKLLFQAILAGLTSENGKARTFASFLFKQFEPKDFKSSLDEIYVALRERAPSGVMEGDGVRVEALKLLAALGEEEAMHLAFEIADVERWGKRTRIGGIIEAFEIYEDSKDFLPQLREFKKTLDNHREANTILVPYRKKMDALMDRLEG